MSRRNKLQKFAELLSFPNVFENLNAEAPKLTVKNGVTADYKGKWAAEFFKNENPVVLELACGRGEYSLALAQEYPQKNFIGVDIKGARIWKGARIALEEKLSNVAFIRTRIEQIHYFFATGEVDEIWITFPDPFLRGSKSSRRLTAPNFLDLYRDILNDGARIHLKTDEPKLYNFTLEVLSGQEDFEVIQQYEDIYSTEPPLPELNIKTYYEKIHLSRGKTIKYIGFKYQGKPEDIVS